MTAEEWLNDKAAQPPAALRSAIDGALRSVKPGTTDIPRQFIAAAESVLARVNENGCGDRSGALDLLTLDALLTYAMESACESSAISERTASAALAAIGAAAGAVGDTQARSAARAR